MLQVKSDTEMQSEVYDITTSEQTDPLVHVHHVYMISQNSRTSPTQEEHHPLIVQVIQ